MKVIHIVTNFDLGGSERVAINIAKAKRNAIEYHIIEVCKGNSQFSKELIQEIIKSNIKPHRSIISNHKLGIIFFPFRLFYLICKLKPQIIHTHAEIADLSVCIFYYLFHIFFPELKYVRTIHSTELWVQWKKIGNWCEQHFFKTNVQNIAISQATKEMYEKDYGNVNIPIIYGYGLSETTATVSFYPSEGFVIGSIGTIMPGLEVKIDPSNSEILVKGKTVTKGYYKRPDENEKSFTEDGFFRTGDAGRIEDGVLYFTERIKDLYKTSNGKYIAPQAIEGLVGSDRYIEQIAVIADQRKFVSALIVPNFQVLEEYVARKGLSFNSREEMVSNPDIIRMFEARIEVCQKNLAPFEKIKRITLLVEPFTMEGKELTDTLKLRRRVIAEKYAEQIEAMYKE